MPSKTRNASGQAGVSDHGCAGGIDTQYRFPKLDNQRIATIRKNESEAVSVDLIDFAGFITCRS